MWEIQRERFSGQNVPVQWKNDPERSGKVLYSGQDSRALLREVFDPMGLTGRSYNKILKVGRTIADLDHSLQIREVHVREALLFRRMAPMAEGMGI